MLVGLLLSKRPQRLRFRRTAGTTTTFQIMDNMMMMMTMMMLMLKSHGVTDFDVERTEDNIPTTASRLYHIQPHTHPHSRLTRTNWEPLSLTTGSHGSTALRQTVLRSILLLIHQHRLRPCSALAHRPLWHAERPETPSQLRTAYRALNKPVWL